MIKGCHKLGRKVLGITSRTTIAAQHQLATIF
jgi:hypothetical protein